MVRLDEGDAVPLDLAGAALARRDVAGGKAGVLGELMGAGFPVPPGFVVTAAAAGRGDLDALLAGALARMGGQPGHPGVPDARPGEARPGGSRFAVRSSAVAEDLPEASYAGLYETFLDVEPAGLATAVRRCFASATAERVTSYHDRHPGDGHAGAAGMAVLVQRMVDAACAGVAFTAHPVTGDRRQVVVTATAGLGERLVSGDTEGAQWTITVAGAELTRPGPGGGGVLERDQAEAVADLARRVADRYGRPQDIEWAIDGAGRLWLLQARPMTALPDPVSWAPPGPGLWMRNFRLGEWLPEAVTPLFATWPLPVLERAYLDGMAASIGVRVPFRYALVNDWYYTATPVPSPRLLGYVIRQGGPRALRVLWYTLIRVGRDPAAADRHALADLYRQWRAHLPRYQAIVDAATIEIEHAPPRRLVDIVDEVAGAAGVYLWYLAIVGGSAWKMEAALRRFCDRYLTGPLAGFDGGVQVLLRGLPGAAPGEPPAHAVQSLDWYHPLAGELAGPTSDPADPADLAPRRRRLVDERGAAEAACRACLAARPRLLARFEAMLSTTQRYAVIREHQARELSLGWPVLRGCARRLGQHLASAGGLADPGDVFFCTRDELDATLAAGADPDLARRAARRRVGWQRRRALAAPVTLGRPPRPIGDVIGRAVAEARGDARIPAGALVGHPASAGRATGPVRLVHGPAEFAGFRPGEVLVARTTTPAFTPLFARAVAVVTDGGTLAAHASLVAREYGIPAVVGTGDATTRLRTGQIITVDGTAGTVTVTGPAAP